MNREKFIFISLFLVSLILGGGIFWLERKLKMKVPEVFLERPFIPANITVNLDRQFGAFPGIWRALAQGGEEPGKRMLEPTIGFLKKAGLFYIRLDHIYDDAFYGLVKGQNPDGSLILDWTNLDATVNDILASGAKPFFSLSYMPSLLSSELTGVPNWQLWQQLVRQTVEHYSGYIEGVYYEVWNEPSLPGFGGWKMYGKKDYRLLYHYAALGARQAKGVKPFKIGGPAIPEQDPQWLKLLFDYVLANNLPLDFISWHRYHFDPQKFVEDVYYVNVLTSEPKYQPFANLEKVISEMGPNSEKDRVYASNVASAHLLAVIRQLLDKVTLVFSFEVKDGPGQEDKGWGLLTHESEGVKPKPRWYIFEWLAELQGQRVEVLGEGTQIKGLGVRREKEAVILLTNYNPYGSTTESFLVTISGLRGGKYKVFTQQLFKKGEEKEIEAGSLLTLNITLPPYSVYRIKLTPLDNPTVVGDNLF